MKNLLVLMNDVFVFIPILFLLAITPYVIRKNIAFGVSIPLQKWHCPEIVKIRRHYTINVLIIGILLFAVMTLLEYLSPATIPAIFINIGIILLLISTTGLYICEYKKVKELVLINKWEEIMDKHQFVIVDTDLRDKKTTVSPLWFLAHIFVIAATVLVGIVMYQNMPDRVPMHFDANGFVNSYAPKSLGLLFFAPLTQLFILLVFIFSYYIIRIAKQQIDTENPIESAAHNRVFKYSWSAFLVGTGFLMLCIFFIMQLSMVGIITDFKAIMIIPFVITFIIIVAAIVLTVKIGQGGSRLGAPKNKQGTEYNRNDTKYWKLGMFYFSPDDPAIFVEKRFGIGWTCNFAKPLSWVIIFGLIAFIIIMITFGKSITGQ